MTLAQYAAPCARACALRTRLLTPAEWKAAAAVGTTEETLAWLKERGVLPEEVQDVATAEHAAHQEVIRNTTSLLRFTKGQDAHLLGFFLHYYDLINLESVMRRIHAMGDAAAQKGLLYDTGPLGFFSDLLGDETNFAALSRLVRRTPFATAYESGLQRYHTDEDIARFVETVEVSFFAEWVKAAKVCGISLSSSTGPTGLSLFLLNRIIESAVRVKLYRKAEASRAVEWLALVASGNTLDGCVKALETEDEESAVRELAALLLPRALLPEPDDEVSHRGQAVSFLRVMALRRALKDGRGIAFNVDFLSSGLVLQVYQALELTLFLESKEIGITDPVSAYGEVAA